MKENISAGVVKLAIRDRSARVQILQDTLDRLRQVITTRASEHSDHPGGATGMLVRDYRGKNAEKEIWRFDAALVGQLKDVLKQAAIEEGQWGEPTEDQDDASGIHSIIERLNAGRKRVADAKAIQDSAPIFIKREIA